LENIKEAIEERTSVSKCSIDMVLGEIYVTVASGFK
jgi:hypothetical protein